MSVKAEGPEYLVELAKAQGIACATVKDGHVLVFTKAHLEMLLAAMAEKQQDKCIVFVKRPEFNG